MQYKQRHPKVLRGLLKTLFSLSFFLPVVASSQTTYLPQGARENVLLERLEIKAGTDSVLNFSKTKPFSRQQFIPALQKVAAGMTLSKVDAYTLYLAQASNIEFATNADSIVSKKRFLKTFYKTPANFYEVNVKDFRLVINPVFQYVVGREKNSTEHLFQNTRGITLRGSIADKISFVSYITDNQ